MLIGFPSKKLQHQLIFMIRSAANFPVRIDMGTPAGLYAH